jgi:sensor histidine kinase YesM
VLVGTFSASQPVAWRFLSIKLLTFRFPIDAMAYWAAVGVAHAARAAATAREREQRAVRLEASLVETRLVALRDRLNPHFFFNTLNAVNTLALRRDHEGVIRTIEAMGALLRVTLTERTGQETTLAAELEFLDRYLEIERLRFGDRLTVVREVDAACLDALVPVMSIQPLAENAIRHGVSVKPGPVEVAVRVYSDADRIRIQVADTGPGFGASAGTNGSGIGLASCRDRLQALYGDRARLACSDRPGGGALVELELPLHFALTPAPA